MEIRMQVEEVAPQQTAKYAIIINFAEDDQISYNMSEGFIKTIRDKMQDNGLKDIALCLKLDHMYFDVIEIKGDK